MSELFDGIKHWIMHRIQWNALITNVRDVDLISIWLEGAGVQIEEQEVGYFSALLTEDQMQRFLTWATKLKFGH